MNPLQVDDEAEQLGVRQLAEQRAEHAALGVTGDVENDPIEVGVEAQQLKRQLLEVKVQHRAASTGRGG